MASLGPRPKTNVQVSRFHTAFGVGGEQDGSRFIVLCETHAHLLGGVGGMSLRKILNLHTSQIASDTICDKISKHFDDTCLRSVTCKYLI